VPGYTDVEKQKIAEGFIVPKQAKENGLGDHQVSFTPDALQTIIHGYTAESGVRGLERQVATVLRKTVRRLLADGRLDPTAAPPAEALSLVLDDAQVKTDLGLPLWRDDKALLEPRPGVANGLAWTEVGGKVLSVEVSLFPGKGELILTGSLGDVMKESARIALSYLKAHGDQWGLKPSFSKDKDIHIHFPEGAIPKDGPSAGITVIASLLSAFRGQPLAALTAMTGEVTLTGRVLPIGGVKEKVLAAHRRGLERIFLPEDNRRDLEEVPEEAVAGTTFLFASTVADALPQLFPDGAFPG